MDTKEWSNYTSSDYTLEQWHRACLIHQHDGPPTSKNQCKLPIRTPSGAVNKNGVFAAAAALAGARTPINASSEQKAKAARTLVRLYSEMDKEPPASLTKFAHSENGATLFMAASKSSGVSEDEAISIVKKNLPDGNINAAIHWEDKYLFVVYTSDADEGDLDPFYSVDKKTGAFAGFSIVGDQDTAGILAAFDQALEHGDFVDESLMHYGVKGMRWGVRRSDEELGRARKKREGPSKASVGLESASNVAKVFARPFIPQANVTSKLMDVGMAVSQGMELNMAVTAATKSPAAAIGYAITGLDSGAYRVPGVAAKNLARGGWKKDESLSKPNMSQSEIQKKVVSGINKDYPGLGTTNNCLRCTYAYEMRRRGFDVAATKTALASGQGPIGPKVMTKSLNSRTKIKKSDVPTGIKGVGKSKRPTEAQVFSTLAKQPNGSRGDFQMRWGLLTGGHSIAYEVINNKPVFFDTQSGKTYSSPAALRSLTAPAQSMSFNRLDNKNLNSTAITAWLKDNK